MLALVAYLALSVLLVVTHGHYAPGPVLALFALSAAFTFGRQEPLDLSSPRSARLLAGVALFGVCILVAGTQLIYASVPEPTKWLRDALFVVPFALSGALVAAGRAEDKRWEWALLGAAAAAALAMAAAKLLVLFASPTPHIDVWTSSVRAVNYFLAGLNPYAQSYDDIYRGAYAYKPSFPYLPGYLGWAALWAAVFGGAHDVRVSLYLAELAVAGLLVAFARRQKLSWGVSAMVAVLWMANPISLFVLEQAWIDPLLIACAVLTLWALTERRFVLAGVALGLVFATKQYSLLFVGLVGLWVLRSEGVKGSRRFVTASVGTALATVLPFALWSWSDFTRSVIGAWADQAPRPDALTLVAWVGEVRGRNDLESLRASYWPFNLATIGLGLASLAWVWRTKDRSVWNLARILGAAHLWFFLFARQAFCNYYYYVLIFLVLAAVLPASPAPGAAAAAAPSTPAADPGPTVAGA